MKATSHKLQAASIAWVRLSLVACGLLLASCGFHLRGAGSAALPEALTPLRVVVEDSRLANDPLLIVMRAALQADPKAVITDDPGAPALVLFGERVESRVHTVSVSGRVSGYMLTYEVSYRLVGPGEEELLAPRSVRLIRDYTFDPLNVLAKEQEERELQRTMQRDAVQQIVRRLSRYQP